MTRVPQTANRFFLFDPTAWRGSRRVQNMPLATRALYLELLCEQWEHGSVPATPEDCAAALGFDLKEWRKAWPKLSACFVARKRDGRLVNQKLEGLKRERERFVSAQREHGRRGGIQRWKKEKTDKAAYGEPVGVPPDTHSLDLKDLKKGSKGSKGSETHTAVRAGFAAFCELYPRKEAFEAAWRVWQTLDPDDDLTRRILAAVERQRRQENWQRESGRFVPLAAKWLQDQRWTDEPPAIPRVSDATLRTLHAAAEFVKS